MSTIRKKPYVEQVLATLTTAQLGQFNTLLNGGSANVLKSLVVGSSNALTTADKGILAVNLELELGKIEAGILVYTDNYCMLCNYHQYQDITIYAIDVANKTYSRKYEGTTIEEIRRITGVLLANASGETAWETALKQHLEYDSDNEMITGDNFTGENVFVKEELEFTDDDVDFGTNAKAKIVSAVDSNFVPIATPTAEQGNKEYMYSFAGTTQYTDIALINDMTSGSASYTDKMIPTAKSVALYVEALEGTSLKATSQDSGKVLTANGSGGASWVYPSATNISSGSATAGQFLVANGSGGATWVTVPNANGNSF